MRIAVYGGSFDPPHLGHVEAAGTVERELGPDRLLIIPACIPPHKDLAVNGPSADQRLKLCMTAFSSVPHAEISDIELRRGGKSYTCDTVEQMLDTDPGAEIIIVIGTDMLAGFENWRNYRTLLDRCTLAVLTRGGGEDTELPELAARFRTAYGAHVWEVPHKPIEASSEKVRSLLPQRTGREMLPDSVYGEIIRHRFYGAKPELQWLREKVMPMIDERRRTHVTGCEREAVRLAERWGEDPDLAAEAAIMHDMTKKLSADEQLNLCRKYGIINANSNCRNYRLLHAVTGAAMAGDLFGADETVCRAIRRHTTGVPEMTCFEKILYLADYIEPTRAFDGIDELRKLAFQDLDAAMTMGLKMTIDEVCRSGYELCSDTLDAYEWFLKKEK